MKKQRTLNIRVRILKESTGVPVNTVVNARSTDFGCIITSSPYEKTLLNKSQYKFIRALPNEIS